MAPFALETEANDLLSPAVSARIVEGLTGPGRVVLPGFLSPEQTALLAAECQALWHQDAFHHARVGHGTSLSLQPEIRSDRVCWIDPLEPTSLQHDYLARAEAIRQLINRNLFLGLDEFECHFAIYPAGSFYQRHSDRFADTSRRTVTCILYLNHDWQAEDGGTLRIYLSEGEVPFEDVEPQGGTLVLFLSDAFEHEVMPAVRARLSLTGWFLQRP